MVDPDRGRTEIAIAVIEHRGEFLIGQRPAGVPLAGMWEFPGGKVQPGEAADAAARRECLEETGLAITTVGQYPTQMYTYDHGPVRLHFFRCQLADSSQPAPIAPFRWVRRADLTAFRFPEANGPILQIIASDCDMPPVKSR